MNDINSIDLLLALRARAELERREIEDMLATRTLRDLDSRGMPVKNSVKTNAERQGRREATYPERSCSQSESGGN